MVKFELFKDYPNLKKGAILDLFNIVHVFIIISASC